MAKGCLRGAFVSGQRVGWDILPRHFYSEIPDIQRLHRTNAWKRPFSMAGVQGADLESQTDSLRSIVTPMMVARLSRGDIYSTACARNGEPGFGQIEAECLHAFVHSLRPRKIVQVGCGVSTAVCLQAASEVGYSPEIVCVEPFPGHFLRDAAAAGRIRLIEKPVEELAPQELMGDIENGDLFFVDSTHCLGPAGEATRLVLEFLPLLGTGAHAHFHDIYFPYDYSPDLLRSALFFHHESPLLHAFLHTNSRFKLSFALSYLHHRARSVIHDLFPSYDPCRNDAGIQIGSGHFPSSAYVTVLQDG